MVWWLNPVARTWIWPELEFGDIYNLIETKGVYTKEKLKAYKSLEAYNYYHNGYVQTACLSRKPQSEGSRQKSWCLGDIKHRSRGPQQAEILDTDAEIRAEILLEIQDPKSQAIFPIISVKYGNSYHVNCNIRHRATVFNRTLLIVGSRIGGFVAQ